MSSSSSTAVHLLIQGRVQGVGFRFFAQQAAEALGLSGWVSNLPNGDVEAYAQGSRADVENWVVRLRRGSPLSRVEGIQISWQVSEELLEGFSIR